MDTANTRTDQGLARPPYDGGDYARARDWRVGEAGEARPESMPPAFEKPKDPFVHEPTITLMRGGVPQRLRGPVATTTRITAETQLGWQKWTSDLQVHGVAQLEASKARAKADREAINDHRRKKAEKLDAMYRRACDRLQKAGKPVPSLEAWKNDRFETKYQRECKKLIAAGFQPRTREQFAAPSPNWEMFAPPALVAAIASMNHRGYNKRRRERYDSQGRDFAGRKTARFIEELVDTQGNPTVAFRSAICISLALFNSSLPKDLVFGEDKGKVESAIGCHLSRTQIRDRAYIELARNRRCHFVVDLDGWWRSVKSLWKAIRKFLLPEFMPNLIVYRARESDGKGVENPHLIWLLPPGSRVIPTKGAKNIESQLKLHAMIQRGIVNQLIELGADPGHHNSDKVKNAISPGWSVACNDDSFCTMSEWKGYLPTITPDERAMTRRAKQIKILRENDVEAELSNALWHDGIASRRLVIKSAQRRRDPTFLAARRSHGAFVEWLYHPVNGAVTRRMIELHGDGPVVRQVLAAQREFVVDLGELPSETGQFCDHGRDSCRNQYREKGYKPNTAEERELVETERKSEAGKVSRANEKLLHCGLIAEEIQRRLSLGLTIEEIGDAKAEIVKALVASGNVSRATAYRRFDEVVAVVSQAARYQAVRNSEQPIESSSSQSSQTVSEQTCLPASGSSASGPLATSPSVGRRPVRPVDPAMLAGQHALRIMETWRRAVVSWRDASRRRCDPDVPTMPSATVGSAFWSKCRH